MWELFVSSELRKRIELGVIKVESGDIYLCKCAHMYFSVFSNIFYDQCALFLKIDKNIYAFRKWKVIKGTKPETAVVFLIN